MSFCKYCGNWLEEDAVCDCPGAAAERHADSGFGQPPQQPQRQPAPPARAQQVKRIADDLLGVLKGYVRHPQETAEERIKAQDIITPAVACGVLFLVLIAVNCCIFGKTSMSVGGVSRLIGGFSWLGASIDAGFFDGFRFHFGLAVLAAFIEASVLPALYIPVRLVPSMLFIKPFDVRRGFFDAFISFGVHSVVPAAAMLTGGLLYFATSFLAQIFFAFALFWYAAVLLKEINGALPAEKKGVAVMAATVGLLAAAAIVYILLFRLMFLMNMGHSVAESKFFYLASQIFTGA